jgi:Flp pilus assembly protein TadD
MDDALANAHANLGAMYMFSDFDWSSAEREYKLALELDSNYELTHELYSYLLTALHRPDEAIAEAQRAVDLDPLSATFSDDLALAYFMARRFDEAEKQNLRTLELEPDRPDTIYRLGNIHTQRGSYSDAVAAYNKAMSLSERSSQFLGALGHVYAIAGKKNEARKVLNEMQELSREKYVSQYDQAIIYAALGESGKAVELLNEAYDQQSGWIINLKVDPFLDPLRDDPQFQKLIERARL